MLGMLFTNAIDTFIKWKEVYAPTAAKRYRPRLYKLLYSLGDNLSLEVLTNDDVVRFHKKMEADGYSRATMAFSLTVVKNFLVFWRNRGQTVPDPKEIRGITFASRIKPIVTPEDFERMSKVLDEYRFNDLRMKLAIHMLWDTGMRISELVGLNISDIKDPNEAGIRTAQILSRKSAKYNLVAWSKETDRLLCLYLGVRLSNDIHSDALFIDTRPDRCQKLDVRSLQRWVKIVAIRAGVTKSITPHSFRHGKAHYMLNNGANIRDVQAVLRHVNPITTFHYLSLNEKQFLDVAEKHLKVAA